MSSYYEDLKMVWAMIRLAYVFAGIQILVMGLFDWFCNLRSLAWAQTSKMLAYGPQTPSFNSQGRRTILAKMHCPTSLASSPFPFYSPLLQHVFAFVFSKLALKMFRHPKRRSLRLRQLSSAGSRRQSTHTYISATL